VRHSFWIALLLPSFAVTADEARPFKPHPVFQTTRVLAVKLSLTAQEYAAMQPPAGSTFGMFGGAAGPRLKSLDATGTDPREIHRNGFGVDLPWARGTVTIDGQRFADVGLRYKGNGTFGDAVRCTKKSFKLELDRHGQTARFEGLKTLNLHCGVADPSKCRETFAYEVYRAAGVPTPRTCLAEVRLSVPGKFDDELLGVYTLVEQVDKPFLKDMFGSDKGVLMKPERMREFDYLGETWDRYKDRYGAKSDPSPKEAAGIIEFSRLIHKADDAAFRAGIEKVLDLDSYFRFLAGTAFICNLDNIFAIGHNVQIYRNPKTDKLHFIPWDVDRSFANFGIYGSADQQMDLNMLRPYPGKHKLNDRILAVPEFAQRYQAILKDLSAKAFARQNLERDLARLQGVVKGLLAKELVAAKARKEVGFGYEPAPFLGKAPDMETYLVKRTDSLAAQIAGTSKGYAPTGGFGMGAFKPGDMFAMSLLDGIDADKDGQLSRGEWLSVVERAFEVSKKDDQGRLNEKALADGINGMMPKPPGEQPKGPQPLFGPGNFVAGPIIRRADTNKDDRANLDELRTLARGLFDAADTGKSSKIGGEALAGMINSLFAPPASKK
jgi:spore coat protein H